MIRQDHNHTLQTNTWYREEEPHNTNSNKTSGKSKAISYLFLVKMTENKKKKQSDA